MALLRQVYNMVFRRSSTFALSIVVGAVFFERVFDQVGDAVFEHMNQGNSGNTSNTIMRSEEE
ncbi:cytochrome b-c1 complex subunit 9 [Scyliorhinus canicula]|uniref:cytochrome b-c1 complex subunit 9 n=1 Tax=Scyliorhinus canicula TaxID=7830 RepID=UPI0018F40155|nr:cytochrome b-c1 complex subunit 9 [Scyliorhinus canicula]